MDRAGFAVEQWRREKPDLDLLPMEVVGRLMEAASLFGTNRLDPLFEKYGLQRGEFDVIATLRRAGWPYSLTPTALYEATMISSGGMTNRLDRLERSGLIERKPNPEDRRGTLVTLTELGVVLVDRIVPDHLENERVGLAGLSVAEQAMLSDLLARLIGDLVSDSTPSTGRPTKKSSTRQ